MKKQNEGWKNIPPNYSWKEVAKMKSNAKGRSTDSHNDSTEEQRMWLEMIDDKIVGVYTD